MRAMSAQELVQFFEEHPWLLVLLAAWILPWKGVALWKSAQRKEKGWFVALLLINTLALLEIFYLFVWTKRKEERGNEVFKRI